MDAKPRTLSRLFAEDARHIVPLYQRPYVWERERQWKPLWDDVIAVTERYLASGNQHGPPPQHFVGAIVLEQQRTLPGDLSVYTVIDGQQRLTTLQLLIAAVAEVAREHGVDRVRKLLRRMLDNDDELVTKAEERFKVWPTNANRAAFVAVMQPGGPPADRVDDPYNRIDEAWAFFLAEAREWVIAENADTDERQRRLDGLRTALSDLVPLVSITLDPGDNAQIIFETLNARGTPLLALDLVKNAVFHRAGEQGADTDTLYANVWRPQLDDDYWREEIRQGRLYRPRAELFLMHWLAMTLKEVIPATELYTTFRSRVLQSTTAPEMANLIPALVEDAGVMRSFDAQASDSVERHFFERVDALDTTTLMPLALLLFRSTEITVSQRRRALRALESWLVRRALGRYTTRSYNEIVPVLLRAVDESPDRADAVIITQLKSGTGDRALWPDDLTMRSLFAHRDLYGWVAQRRLVMVLHAVEHAFRLEQNKSEGLSGESKLTIEHIVPQKWQNHWPLPEDAKGDAAADRDALINHLGNLTLTTGELNSAMSHASWPVKRQALVDHSLLLLNKRVVDHHPHSFTEKDIKARGAELADKILEIWPGPDSAEWASEQAASAAA